MDIFRNLRNRDISFAMMLRCLWRNTSIHLLILLILVYLSFRLDMNFLSTSLVMLTSQTNAASQATPLQLHANEGAPPHEQRKAEWTTVNSMRMVQFLRSQNNIARSLNAYKRINISTGVNHEKKTNGSKLLAVTSTDENDCFKVHVNTIRDIPVKKHHMQEVVSPGFSNLRMFLFAAYYDDRELLPSRNQSNGTSYVRVTGTVHTDSVKHTKDVHCALWYEGELYAKIVPGSAILIWEYYGPYQTFMITCPIPNHPEIPTSVSILKEMCDTPTNLIDVSIKSFSKRSEKVGVCAKVIYGTPDATRIVEWIELNKLLGANAIYMYNASLKGAVNDVLDYYQEQEEVVVFQHDFVEHMARLQYNQSFPTFHYQYNWEMEVLSMTDCLYRANERYVVNIDIDEILHPVKYESFMALLKDGGFTTHPKSAGLTFHTGVFTDEFGVDNDTTAPAYLHTMRHTTRTTIDWESPKSIIHAERCKGLAHHVCMKPLEGYTHRADVPEQFGYLRHYRQKCRLTGEPNKCEKLLKHPVKDTALRKYLAELDSSVKYVLEKFKLIV